jgi:hypothetical protein
VGDKSPRNTQALVKQLQPEAIRLGAILEEQAVILDARNAEIVGHRPDRDHEVVVANAMPFDDLDG